MKTDRWQGMEYLMQQGYSEKETLRKAIPLITDSGIKEVFGQREKVLEELKRKKACFMF